MYMFEYLIMIPPLCILSLSITFYTIKKCKEQPEIVVHNSSTPKRRRDNHINLPDPELYQFKL